MQPQPGIREDRQPITQQKDSVPIPPAALGRVVRIENHLPNPRTSGAGSSVVFATSKPGHTVVLTAKHIFCPNGDPRYSPRPGRIRVNVDGTWYGARWVGADAKEDLAAVEFNAARPLPTVCMDQRTSLKGRKVIMVGYGEGRFRSVPGVYQGTKINREYGYSFHPISGDSGGGVFTRPEGHLVGIVTANWGLGRTEAAGTVGTAVGREAIRSFWQTTCWPWWRNRYPNIDIQVNVPEGGPGPSVVPSPGGGGPEATPPALPATPNFDRRFSEINQIMSDGFADIRRQFQEVRSAAAQDKADTNSQLGDLRKAIQQVNSDAIKRDAELAKLIEAGAVEAIRREREITGMLSKQIQESNAEALAEMQRRLESFKASIRVKVERVPRTPE